MTNTSVSSLTRNRRESEFLNPIFVIGRRIKAAIGLISSGELDLVVSKLEMPWIDSEGSFAAAFALIESGKRDLVNAKFENPGINTLCRYVAAHSLIDHGERDLILSRFENPGFDFEGYYAAAHSLIDHGERDLILSRFENPDFDFEGYYAAARALSVAGERDIVGSKLQDSQFPFERRIVAARALIDVGEYEYVFAILGCEPLLFIAVISLTPLERFADFHCSSAFISALQNPEIKNFASDGFYEHLMNLYQQKLPQRVRQILKNYFDASLRLHFKDKASANFMINDYLLRANHPLALSSQKYRDKTIELVTTDEVFDRLSKGIARKFKKDKEDLLQSLRLECIADLTQNIRKPCNIKRLSKSFTTMWGWMSNIAKPPKHILKREMNRPEKVWSVRDDDLRDLLTLSAQDLTIKHEDFQRVRDMMRTLGRLNERILELRFDDELTHGQIAEMVGLRRNQIRDRIPALLEKLRMHLKEVWLDKDN